MTAATTPSDPQACTIGLVGVGVVGGRIRSRIGSVLPGARINPIDTRIVDISSSSAVAGLDVVVLAHPGPHHLDARRFAERGVAVVSVGDQVADVREMLALDDVARNAGVPLVIGAGMSSGLAALLARHLSADFDVVDEVHIGIHGTAGPACARQHHRALAGTALSWIDGVERRDRSGTGRQLAWFPEPVGAYDCYHAELPAPLVIREAFPQVTRIQARVSANRRDRLTSRLPMLTRPHREGGVGAVRVEVRGADAGGARITEIAGIAELVGTATAATASAFADLVVRGAAPAGVVVPGSAELDTTRLLETIVRLGVRLQEFTGVPSA